MSKSATVPGEDKLYLIVERLRDQPKEQSRNKKLYNFSDPTALRALRIHRHLRALENEILEGNPRRTIHLEVDPRTDQIVLSIRNEEVHCCRVAYLSQREYRLLRKNRKVANALRKCAPLTQVA